MASSPGAAPDPTAATTSSRGGGIPVTTPAASAAPRGGGHSSHVFIGSGGGGGGILDIFALGGCSSRVFIGTGTGGVGSSTWGGHSSHLFIGSGGYVGGCGDIFPRRGYFPAIPAAEVTDGTHLSGSRVGPPAVVGASPSPPASDPSVGVGAATGELLVTEQEQLVASGGRREVLAEGLRMAGGTSPVCPGALPAALPAPPGPAGMVHDGGAGGRW